MKFRINYNKVISQADSICDNADELRAQIALLSQLEREVRTCWKGDAADAFLSKLNQLEIEMKQTMNQMVNLASTIRYCADRIKREDEAAARKASSLTTGR